MCIFRQNARWTKVYVSLLDLMPRRERPIPNQQNGIKSAPQIAIHTFHQQSPTPLQVRDHFTPLPTDITTKLLCDGPHLPQVGEVPTGLSTTLVLLLRTVPFSIIIPHAWVKQNGEIVLQMIHLETSTQFNRESLSKQDVSPSLRCLHPHCQHRFNLKLNWDCHR